MQPIDRLVAGVDEVQDIRAIEAFAVSHVCLDPDEILDGRDADGLPQDGRRLPSIVPLLVDCRAPPTKAVNQVDVESSTEGVCQPVWCRGLDGVAVRGKGGQRRGDIVWDEKEIEIFRVAPEAG